MYIKTCEGCGKAFEAIKPTRKWCSDVCGKRQRRRDANTGVPIPPVVVNPDMAMLDMAWVREQIAFARDVCPGLVLPLDVVERLLDADDDDESTQSEYDTVESVLVARAVGRLGELSSRVGTADEVLADLKLLSDFLQDWISPRIVSALAAAL